MLSSNYVSKLNFRLNFVHEFIFFFSVLSCSSARVDCTLSHTVLYVWIFELLCTAVLKLDWSGVKSKRS